MVRYHGREVKKCRNGRVCRLAVSLPRLRAITCFLYPPLELRFFALFVMCYASATPMSWSNRGNVLCLDCVDILVQSMETGDFRPDTV